MISISTHVANINNGVADPLESATVAACNVGILIFRYLNLLHSSANNRYAISVTASGGGLLFDGNAAGNADCGCLQFNGAQTTHTITWPIHQQVVRWYR